MSYKRGPNKFPMVVKSPTREATPCYESKQAQKIDYFVLRI